MLSIIETRASTLPPGRTPHLQTLENYQVKHPELQADGRMACLYIRTLSHAAYTRTQLSRTKVEQPSRLAHGEREVRRLQECRSIM